MKISYRTHALDFLLRNGAGSITTIDYLDFKLQRVKTDTDALELVALMDENPRNPSIQTFPVLATSFRLSDDLFAIDGLEESNTTIYFRGTRYHRAPSERCIVIAATDLEKGLLFHIEADSILADILGHPPRRTSD